VNVRPHRISHDEAFLGTRVAPDAFATPARARRIRPRAYWPQVLGRSLVIWIVAYLVLRIESATLETAELATLVTAVFLPLIQWARYSARAMPLAFGMAVVVALGSLAGLVVLSAIAFWLPDLALDIGGIAAIAVLVLAATTAWDTFVRRAASAPARIVIVGGSGVVSDVARETEAGSDGRPRFEIVGVVKVEDPEHEPRAVYLADRRWPVATLDDFDELITRAAPDLVVIAVGRGRPEVFERLLGAAHEGFRVVGLPEFYEIAFARLPLRELTPAWFMSALHLYNRPYNRVAKRGFDIVVSLIGLAATLILFPLIAAVVKRTPGPLLYRQERLGEHGRSFEIVKFRSMCADAEGPGSARFAEESDPRIIPGGRWIRRLHLDELPQLWNVLRGDMSIVGPRPERPEFLERLAADVPFWTQRLLVKPGITGWAQIRSAYASDSLEAQDKLSYDLWYLRHRSLLLDAVICLKTIGVMATGSGSR
jgi:exopolysaccharide biosynthesis polyprenyl glycosylphosphotransferase